MLFCGIDLHSNNSVVVISYEDDKVLYSKRHPNNLEEIRSVLSPYQTDLFGVVVESTFNWYWLVDGLQESGCQGGTRLQCFRLIHMGDWCDSRNHTVKQRARIHIRKNESDGLNNYRGTSRVIGSHC